MLKTGGARLADIVRMNIYCTDRDAFYSHGKEVGKIYNKYFGGYVPAVTLVEVSRLFTDGMMIEIDVVAHIEE